MKSFVVGIIIFILLLILGGAALSFMDIQPQQEEIVKELDVKL